jgi:hypothetical protein
VTTRAGLLCIPLLLIGAACTDGHDPVAEPQPSDGSAVVRGADDGNGSEHGGQGLSRTSGGPLAVDGNEGDRVCYQRRDLERTLTVGNDVLRSRVPVELQSISLVGPRGVRLVAAWAVPTPDIVTLGVWDEWPLPADTRDRLGWDQRMRAVGARLEPGRPYTFLLRTRRAARPGAQGFESVRLEYRSADGAHVTRTHTVVSFRKQCRS